MTPEEYQQLLASQQVRPRKMNPMWQITNARGFMETDPFSDPSPFDLKSDFEKQYSPFFPRRRV